MIRSFLCCFFFFQIAQGVRSQSLEPLRYNNPGLEVDLGVGLWAWPVPCDADGDGDFDLIVSCPDKPSNGVWYFENISGDTSSKKLPSFRAGKLLSKTVHYVMPSYTESGMRVLSPGVEYVDFRKQGTTNKIELPIEAKFHKPKGSQPKGPKLRHNQWRYVDFDGDNHLDLIAGIEDWSYYGWDDAWDAKGVWKNGPLHGWIYVFRNLGTTETPRYASPEFLNSDGQQLEVFGCPSPNFEDFDADGDLDLLCGEFLDGFTYFENVGTRQAPKYSAGRRVEDVRGEPLRMTVQMIVPVAFDWDRDGDFDLIVGEEDGRVAFVENTGKLKNQMPVFEPPKYFQQEADTLKCGALATPFGVDWDHDGDMDIVSGNTAGFIEYFENLSGPRIGQPRWGKPVRLRIAGNEFRIMAGDNGSIQGPAEAKWGYTTLSVADWDGDGLHDIIFNSILGRVCWIKNTGTKLRPRFESVHSIDVEWDGAPPTLAWGWLKPKGNELLTQWRTTPVVFDFNRDGLVDIAMLDHEGYLAFFERAKKDGKTILKPPRRAFLDAQGKPIRLNSGDAGKSGRRKLCVTDWDGDGKFDFLLNSTNADLLKQLEYRNDCWIMQSAGTLASRNIEGHDVSPTVVDFDGDGISDFVGGAEDGRLYFLSNPRTK